MTILDAGGKLYEWFAEHDSFNLEEDFSKIILVTDHPNRDRAAFFRALEDLKRVEIIDDCQIDDKLYWILKKPFMSYSQTIEIQPDLAITISGIVNKFCEMMDNEDNICDPVNIHSDDIKKVIYIANLMLQQKDIDESSEQ